MPWQQAGPADRKPELVKKYVKIYWDEEDGPGRYYQGRVMKYDRDNDTFFVKYEIVNPGEKGLFEEAFGPDDKWLLWDGHPTTAPPATVPDVPVPKPADLYAPTNPVAAPYPIRQQAQQTAELRGNPNLAARNVTYTDMALQALEAMDTKGGGSLVAVRKWIVAQYPETMTKQKASFNSLTKKAVSKLVADGMAMKIRGTFRVNPDYLQRKKMSVDGGRSMPLGGDVRVDALMVGDKKSRFGQDQENIFQRNRELREELQAAIARRDEFLLKHKAYFLPFLPEHRNFFTKLQEAARTRCVELQNIRVEMHRMQLQQEAREQEVAFINQTEDERLRALKAAVRPYSHEMDMVARFEQQGGAAAFPAYSVQPPRFAPPPQQYAYGAPGGYPPQGPGGPGYMQQPISPSGQQYDGMPPPHQQPYGVPGPDMGGQAWQQQPAPAYPGIPDATPAEAKADTNVEFHDFPVDGGPEALDVLTRMGVVSEADKRSGAALSVNGKPLDVATLLPPLEMNHLGQLTMQDSMLIGQVVQEEGPCKGFRVIWPGSRVQLDQLPKEGEKDLITNNIEWKHLYWMRDDKPDAVPPRRNKNEVFLRLRDGTWVQHRHYLVRTTQKYAETKRIPVDNQIHINYIHPVTGQWEVAHRDYCWHPRFAEAVRRTLKSKVAKDLASLSKLQAILDALKTPGSEARAPSPPVRAPQVFAYGEIEDAGSHFAPQGPPPPQPYYPQQQPPPRPMASGYIPGGYMGGPRPPHPRMAAVPPGYPDPAMQARVKWMRHALNQVKMESLEGSISHYECLLDEGRGLPPDLLQPVRQASLAAQERFQQVRKLLLEASKATPAVKEPTPDYLVRALGEDHEADGQEGGGGAASSSSSGKARSLVVRPIESMAGVPIVDHSRTITTEPHQHQVEGLSWLVHMYKNHMPAILGDQMGLGKTFQAIAFLAYLKDNLNVKGPHLIVVPLSVLSNWMAEFERFCPSMRCVRFHGPKPERARIKIEELNDVREFDVVVTTYEILVSEANFFRRKFVWRVLIVDEGHRLKNEKSQLSECLRRVPAFYRLLLTGTPTQNNLRELWALFHYLLHEVFPAATADTFAESFDAGKNVMDMNRLRASRALLSLVMLRRRKEHISMQLPSKTELAVMCGLSSLQRAWYKRVLTGIQESMLTSDKSSMGEGDWRKLLNLLLQLRKVCNHPYLMTNSEYSPDERLVEASGKLMVLDRMLPKLREDGHRVLLFSQFTSMLDILEDFCMMRGFEYCRLDGSTNRVQRRLDIRRYNAVNSPLFIFLISTRAGGQGINLASADTVILYDSDWNPQVDLQAMERCHRIGQTKPVRVYRLVVRKSVEERMVSRAHRKLFLNEMVAEKAPAGEQKGEDEELLEEAEEEEEEGGVGATGGVDDELTEMKLLQQENANESAKDEVARMIRSGVTALFETGRTEVSDEEIDILLGRREGVVDNAINEADDERTAKLWQQKDEMQLEDVDVRELEGISYAKPDAGHSKKPEKSGMELSDMVSGTRKRKQRTVMVDGKGTGYGGAVPVLAQDLADQEAESSGRVEPPHPKRIRRDWDHEKACFLCQKNVDPKKAAKVWVKCGWCPRVYHFTCLEGYTGEKVDGTTTVVCPQHKCCMCVRNTAAAGGMLFRCVDCPKAYCEDCLEDELVESLGRWKPLEQLNYISKMAYWIRCTDCVRHAAGEDDMDEDETGVEPVAAAPPMEGAGEEDEDEEGEDNEDGEEEEEG